MLRYKILCHFQQIIPTAAVGSAFRCPRSARVQNIPCRLFLPVPIPAGIVVSETVYNPIPERQEPLDEERFTKRYPDIVYSQIAACKLGTGEVRRLLDIACVFSDPLIEYPPWRYPEPDATFACSCRDSLSDINWHLIPPLAIQGSDLFIRREGTSIVDYINAGTFERLWRWQGRYSLFQ